MTWYTPIDFRLVQTSFRRPDLLTAYTELPIAPHPGAYGAKHKHHIHEGVDLYCPVDTLVSAVETGIVVVVMPFTGAKADPPTDAWWHDTEAVLVEGPTGVVVYGEISPLVIEGERVYVGDPIGRVLRVLKVDKGVPTSMLHLELHEHGTRGAWDWAVDGEKPPSLRDPTPFLQKARR